MFRRHLEVCERSTTSIDGDAKYCKLLLVNPATSATAERSFSLARRLKTWMCSTMLPGRLNAIAILHEQKTLTDRLNLTDIAKEFVCCNESRKCAFGNFY